ncbi:MAG: ATP-binding protein [Opitutaceae bacterium]|jgi:predicted AAA+ superfamily ATPase|nr:ATP-binding protein [Opitutaceae bacterium]
MDAQKSSGKHYPRHAMAALETAMGDTPVICLLGPRQTGKSTLARQLEPERAYFSLDDAAIFSLAQADPAGFVASLPERVTLDEIQRVPALLPAIKMAVDRKRTPGRFLMTGSANLLLLPQISESLAGRMEIVNLYPLTEAEKERSAGLFLKNLLEGKLQPRLNPAAAPPDGGASLARRIVGGGYPEPLTRPPVRARQWHRHYVQAILQRDAGNIFQVRNLHELTRLMELLALRTGKLLNTSGLAGELGMTRATTEHYLGVLERLFLVHRLPAWHRSAARRLVKTPKIHLVDSGLAATLSQLTADDWMGQRARFGHLLETFVLQQLLAQGGWLDPGLRFSCYRDKDQVEVDVVINRGRQVWGIEIKASSMLTAGEARGLRRLAAQAGADFRGGVLLYAGAHAMHIGPAADKLLAMPLAALWEM